MRRFVLSTLTIASTCYVHGAPATDRASHIAELRILDPTYDPGYEYHPYPVDAVEKSLRPNTGVNAVPLSLDTPKPAVMLKLDDLDAGNFDQFAQVARYLQKRRLHASFGVITQRMAGTGRSLISQRMCSWLLEKQNSGNFEIWNHGLMHLPGEMDERDLGDTYTLKSSSLHGHVNRDEYHMAFLPYSQVNALKTSQELLSTCGLRIAAYGSPYNAANNYTLAAIRSVPDIKLWFFPTPGTFTAADLEANAPILLDPRRTRLDMEQAAGVISFDFFKANYDAAVRRNITTVHVLQGHPPKWNATHFDEFQRIIDFLVSEGHPFITPTEYFVWQN